MSDRHLKTHQVQEWLIIFSTKLDVLTVFHISVYGKSIFLLLRLKTLQSFLALLFFFKTYVIHFKSLILFSKYLQTLSISHHLSAPLLPSWSYPPPSGFNYYNSLLTVHPFSTLSPFLQSITTRQPQ